MEALRLQTTLPNIIIPDGGTEIVNNLTKLHFQTGSGIYPAYVNINNY